MGSSLMTRNEYYQKLTQLSYDLEQIEFAIKEFHDDYDVYTAEGNVESDYISLVERAKSIASKRYKLMIERRNLRLVS